MLEDKIRQRVTSTTLLQVGGFVEKWSVELMWPYINQKRKVSGVNGINEVTSGGIGDAALIAGRGFKNFHFSAGVKAPSGSINKLNNGIRLNADMQNGSDT
ncbi:MAG: hypothetical protein ACI9V1_003090 [Spirosomataceae bacterium]